MPLPVHFEKRLAESFLDSIKNGRPIECPDGGWTRNALLATAGACHFAALSQGPVLHEGVDLSALPDERREAITLQFFAELEAAVRVYSHLTMLVADAEYDAVCKPVAKALIHEEDGIRIVNPVDGMSPNALDGMWGMGSSAPEVEDDDSADWWKHGGAPPDIGDDQEGGR
jgi:hypothetical protein